jgi:hypothetical protein
MKFKGVTQIVMFNWPLYAAAIGSAALALAAKPLLPESLQALLLVAVVLGLASMCLSLIASWYVYDLTNLYKFDYLPALPNKKGLRIANIHAGFDETTEALTLRFPNAVIDTYDFYDPAKHTAASIRRARARYPAPRETVSIDSSHLPIGEATYDAIFLVFAAHEIRDDAERVAFFKELRIVAKPEARIFVVEHLRDWRNALVYSIGCLHFHSEACWQSTFELSGWHVVARTRPNALITAYTIECSSS